MSTGPLFGVPRNRNLVNLADIGRSPGGMVYEYLTEVSGPSGGDEQNMNPAASDVAPTIYEVDLGLDWLLSRITMGLFDSNPTPGKFGGQAELTNGVKVAIVNVDGAVTQDFTGSRPITKNADFNYLTGVDTVIESAAGQGFVRIRFSITRAGDDIMLSPTDKMRFTIQDDLSGMTEFRAMAQGIVIH